MSSTVADLVLDQASRLITHRLAIKANPPAYNKTVASIADSFARKFKADVRPQIEQAVTEIAALVETEPNGRKRPAKARRIMARLSDELEAKGQDLSPRLVRLLGRGIATAYKLGLEEVTAPLGYDVSFSLPDADAIAGLQNAGLFWVGEHYGSRWTDRVLQNRVRRVLLEKGLGRVEAGDRVRDLLGAKFERSDLYWRGLAATVATRARSFGALEGMVETGATSYEYVNPLDERTSAVCRELDGTVFTVAGSVELREKLLAAPDPESVKAIAPWPKHSQLVTSSGAKLTAPELQAKGIAWPPLHFHCRSSIDVHTFGAWPEIGDPLGDTDVARRRRPRVPKVKPAAAPKPKKKPKKKRSELQVARAEYRAAMKAAKDAGLEPDKRFALSEDGRAAGYELIERARTRMRLRYGTDDTSGSGIDMWRFDEGTQSHAWRPPIMALQRFDDRRLYGSHGASDEEKEQARMLLRDLELNDAVVKAYRRLSLASPPEWRERERAKWVKRIMPPRRPTGITGGMTPELWTQVKERFTDSTRVYGPDILRLLAVEGINYKHDGLNNRAAAAQAWRGQPGHAYMDLRKLARFGSTGTHAFQTVPHELGHLLDQVQDKGTTGVWWKNRPGYDDARDLHQATFMDTYQRAHAGDRRTTIGSDGAAWAGNFVDPYEGRIYAGGGLAGSDRDGPVEFIAMASSYRAEEVHAIMQVPTRVGFNPGRLSEVGYVVDSETTVRGRGVWAHVIERTYEAPNEIEGGSRLRLAWKLYGNEYRDGQERMYGTGRRMGEHLANNIPTEQWQGDEDVKATAVLLSSRFGTPLDQLLGDGGVMARHLSTGPMNEAELRKLGWTIPQTASQGSARDVDLRAMREIAPKLIEDPRARRPRAAPAPAPAPEPTTPEEEAEFADSWVGRMINDDDEPSGELPDWAKPKQLKERPEWAKGVPGQRKR